MYLTEELAKADVVITISHRDGIKIIKNRDGERDVNIDLAKVLETLLPFQKEYLRPLIAGWILKLKTYRLFS